MPKSLSPTTIFAHATALPRPDNVTTHSQQDSGHTITIETLCLGQARQYSEFLRDAMEFAGMTGAAHAGRSLIARAEKDAAYLSIRVDLALH